MAIQDPYKKLDVELQPSEEDAFFKQTRSSDDMIDELTRRRTWKYTLMIIAMSVSWIGSPSSVYITSFAGLIPGKNDTWRCVSQKCIFVMGNESRTTPYPCDYVQTDDDGNLDLVFGPEDIEWPDMKHTSFAVEFDVYCDVGPRKMKKTLMSSMYFPGALIGLLMGGYLYDNVGRRVTAMVTAFLSFLVHLSAIFCHDFNFLLAIRFFQGFLEFITNTAILIIQLELVSNKHRNLINGFGGLIWALGSSIVSAIGYLIPFWNYMYVAVAVLGLVARLSIYFFTRESPRFYLVKGDMKSAKESFEFLESLTTANLKLDHTKIVDGRKTESRTQNIGQQLKDLIRYPSLLKETLLVAFLWFCIAMFFYGFNFGWGQIVPDFYIGYVVSSCGSFIASLVAVPLIQKTGRRRAMMIMHVLASLIFLLAILEVEIGRGWSLESVCSLFGVTFVAGCFSGIYLMTGEVAPTSHRGFMYGVGSGAARIGSFIGPYIFNNLKPVTHRAVPFGGLAIISFLCALAAFLLVETGDKEMICVAADVETRRKGYKYRL